MIYAIIALVWIVSAVFIFGATLAYFQRAFPMIAVIERDSAVRLAWKMVFFAGAAGPLGALMIFLSAGFLKHGLMYKA